MQQAPASTATQSRTLRVPAVAPAPDPSHTIELRCTRRDCTHPGCGKLVLTLKSTGGVLPTGLSIVRECPRQRSLLCEFHLDNAVAGKEALAPHLA